MCVLRSLHFLFFISKLIIIIALTQAGVSREDAYKLVQRNAMKVWEAGGKLSPDEECHRAD